MSIETQYIGRDHKISWRLAVAVALMGLGQAAWSSDLNVEQIMERNFLVSRFPGATFEATFNLISKDGATRVRRTSGASKLREGGPDMMRITRFIEPADVRGTATLVVEQAARDDDIWVYLPALRKVRRLVSNNKRDSFLGTDFSYSDVVGFRSKDWRYRLVGESEQDGRPCYLIEGLPRSEDVRAQTGYGRRVDCVSKDAHVTLRSEMWDESNQPLKQAIFRDLQQPDPKLNRWQPMLMEATNLQNGHRTSIRFAKFKVVTDMGNEPFSPRTLESE